MHSNLILAYHGCNNKALVENVIHNKCHIRPSENNYDWLGHGIYFWENDPQRAFEWAKETCARKGGEPAVIGAVLNLGNCLDLIARKNIEDLKNFTTKFDEKININELPENDGIKKRRDCTIIEYFKFFQEVTKKTKYDSVRSVFIEGDAIYPGGTFKDKNHIQIAVINPDCIKAYFIPKGY